MVDHLRPTIWEEYLGQERIKTELDIRIQSALHDERPLDNVLLAGPPGAGKTSLAQIIAARLGETFEVITMPIGKRDLIKLVHSFEGVVLFDEIHRCSVKEQEALLPLLEFGYVADGANRHLAEWLTIVGATTEKQKLIEPLIDRFEIKPDYDDYTDEQMARIALSMGAKADLDIGDDVADTFGKAAAGTPRRVRAFILGYRDLRNATGEDPTAEEVLDLCQTEWDGLTTMHMRYLETLKTLGACRGLDTIVSLMRQPKPMVVEWERLLIERGFIQFGDRGRVLTEAGNQRIGGTVVKSPRRKEAA